MVAAPEASATMIYIPVSFSSCEHGSRQAACWGGPGVCLPACLIQTRLVDPTSLGLSSRGDQGQRVGHQGLETKEILRLNWLEDRRPGLATVPV